jgi:hypothetical protein
MRRIGLLSLLATFAFALVIVSAAAARTESLSFPRRPLAFANLLRPSAPIREHVLRRSLLNVNRVAWSGGNYQTPDGYTIRIYVSDGYPPDPTIDQSYANFLGSLLHGPELGNLTVYVLTPPEISTQCGVDAAACYYPAAHSLFMAGEDNGGVPLEQAVAHEYGHHIAANRDNTPWSASDWGPKRWASYQNVCANVAQQKLFPGAEPPDPNYTLNPGEGWAEAYRYYNEQLAGNWPYIGWNVVDPFFKPDANALTLVHDDVVDPWTGPSSFASSGRLRRGRTAKLSVATPLDGNLTVAVTGTASPAVVAEDDQGSPISGAGRYETATICGEQHVSFLVHAARKGRFTLRVSIP